MINPFAFFSALLCCYELKVVLSTLQFQHPFPFPLTLILTLALLCSITCCFSFRFPKHLHFLHHINYILHTLVLLTMILSAEQQDTLQIPLFGTTLTLFMHQIPPILQILTLPHLARTAKGKRNAE